MRLVTEQEKKLPVMKKEMFLMKTFRLLGGNVLEVLADKGVPLSGDVRIIGN